MPRPIGDADLDAAIDGAPPRIRAMLLLAAYGGLRCCELANLDAANVDVEHRRLFVVGKGKRERVVPLHPEVWAASTSAPRRLRVSRAMS